MQYKAFVPYSDKHGYQEFYFEATDDAKYPELRDALAVVMAPQPARMFNPKLALIVKAIPKEGEKE